MRRAALLCLLLATVNTFAATPEAINAAVQHPDRPGADLQRDRTSKPVQLLRFAGLDAGMTVVDLEAGGGYFTEILARTVGEDGRVFMQNSSLFLRFAGSAVEQRVAGNRLPNVVVLRSQARDLGLPDGQLDLAIAVQSFHDLWYAPEDCVQGGPPCYWDPDPLNWIAQLHAALKPDGTLLIIDHSAETDTGTQQVQSLHRIDAAWVESLLTENGFELTGSSDALHNPADDRLRSVFDPAIRGRTDRFVLRFRRMP